MQTIEGKGRSVRWKVPAILNHYYPTNHKTKYMEQDSICEIKNQLRLLGIDPEVLVGNDLIMHIAAETQSFDICDQIIFEGEAVLKAHLYFFKSPVTKAFVLQKYQASLCFPDDPEKDKTHVFDRAKGTLVTLREAFNLLCGRSVFTEITPANGDNYSAWIQLNFAEKTLEGNYLIKRFRAYNGYDLGRLLSKYPIRELNDTGLKADIIQGLRRGDLIPVTFLKPSGRTEKKLIEFNPVHKLITIYMVRRTIQSKRNSE